MFKRLWKEELFQHYFDEKVNREIFERTCAKCYFPSNRILLDLIDQYKGEKKQVKVAFSLSGTFLEYCEMFNKDLLETFRQLAKTGCAEFVGQTYYHSLASLYPERDEFVDQVQMHQQTIRSLLEVKPKVFENTELLYNNIIANTVQKMGFKGIFTEGAERILRGKSPNFLYRPIGCDKIKVLLRNYKLTDDIGFRFSSKTWNEWPLTAPKYAGWLAETPGDYVCIFPDYETFGEHHWPETGIHEFLRHLPDEILKHKHLNMATPSDVLERYKPVGEIDVPELGGTVSWADVKRDASGWLGNTMQWAYYLSVRRLEPLVKESEDKEFLRLWRYFQVSDHLYYMFAEGGGPGEVHTYFSPYRSGVDAYVTAQSAVLDFENRVKIDSEAANEPFLFYEGKGEKHFTGLITWTLKGFSGAIQKAGLKSLMHHNSNNDFEKWAQNSLRDDSLAERFRKVRLSKLEGEELRKALAEALK
jgi:alpha-amylase